MQNRQGAGRPISGRIFRTAALIAAGCATLTSAPLSAEAPVERGVTVTITVSNMRNTDGVVRACMTTDADRFPRCQGTAGAHSRVVNADSAATITFRNVEPGTYAIALLHDENDNGRADRALGMMPTEGFGFSNDARVRMGPPRFDEAAITIGSSPFRQTIRMRYMV